MAQGRRRGTSGIIPIGQSGIRRVSALIVQRPCSDRTAFYSTARWFEHPELTECRSGIDGMSRQDQAGFPI